MTVITAEAYTKLFPALVEYVYRRSGDRHLGEDMAAQTFANALAAERRGTHICNVRSWLFRSAHNLLVDYYRHRTRFPHMTLEALAEQGEWQDLATPLHNRQALARALQMLPSQQRLVIQLRYGEGYSYEEIGDLLSKSPDAVKSIKLRALVTLRARMTGELLHGD